MVTRSVELRFDVAAASRLAEDAAAASEHRTRWEPGPTLDHPGFQVDAGPCLMLVRDDGVYLMSTDKNAPRNAEGRVPICYASGFDPRSGNWWSRWDQTGLPGDDFVEYLEVSESGLLNDLRAATKHGYRWFIVTLRERSISIRFEDGIPPASGGETPSDQ